MNYPRGFLTDGETGQENPVLTNAFYIGSAIDCNIRLSPTEVSQRHCLIKVCGLQKVTIYSLDSVRPVLLNEQEVVGDDCVLNNGDAIRIANNTYIWKEARVPPQASGFKNMSLIINNIEEKGEYEEKRYSAPARLEDKEDHESFAHCTLDDIALCEQQKRKSRIEKNATQIKEVNEAIDEPLLQTPEKDEIMENAHSVSQIHTPKHFDNAYHSTPKAETSATERYVKESSIMNLGEADVSASPNKFRGRRSTGIVPCVGTPSDVYRVSKSILTPGFRQRWDRLASESEKKQCVLTSGKKLVRQRSSERKSTPLKPRFSDKESLIHSPIIETSEQEKSVENQNESTNLESRYKFVAFRRRRFGSNFASENRIAEESETSRNDVTDEYDENLAEGDEEENLMETNSDCDKTELPMATRTVENGDNTLESTQHDSTFTIDTEEDQHEDVEQVTENKDVAPKSILTPAPKSGITNKEKSAKKVTFARNIINESSDENSLVSNGVTNNSYSFALADTSDVHSSIVSVENSALDSFCHTDELFLEDKTSELGVSTCSTPVSCASQKQSSGFEDGVPEASKTPTNSPMNEDFSFSVRESNFPWDEDDVDLTRAEKLKFLNDRSANDSVRKSNGPTRSSSPDSERKFETPEGSPIAKENSDQIIANDALSVAEPERRSENNDEVADENELKDSNELPEIIVTEFIDSNENTVSVERSTITPENIENMTDTEEVEVVPVSTTPSANSENVEGMKLIFKTPVEAETNTEKKPRGPVSSYEDFVGVEELMKTPLTQVSNVEVLQASPHLKSRATIVDTSTTDIFNISKARTPSKQNISMSESRTPINYQSILLAESLANSVDTTLMKTCTEDSTQISTVTPCTSTPHLKTQNLMHQNDSHQISEISELRQQVTSVSDEINSKASCNLPDIAVLESETTEGNVTEAKIADMQQTVEKKFETPKANYENVDGIKQMFKTPNSAKVNYEDVRGIKEMFKTPSEAKVTYENVGGMKEMFKTPVDARSTYEDVQGVKRIFKTPCENKCTYENVSGVEELLETPRLSNHEDVNDVDQLKKTPKVSTQLKTSVRSAADPIAPLGNIMEGVQELPESPPPRSPINVQSDVVFEVEASRSRESEGGGAKGMSMIGFQKSVAATEATEVTSPQKTVVVAGGKLRKSKVEIAVATESERETEVDQIPSGHDIPPAEIEEIGPGCVPITSKVEILLSRTESPLGTPRKTPKKSPKKMLKSEAIEVMTRSSTRRATPAKLKDNQENEVHISINNTRVTPSMKRKGTPLKRNIEKSLNTSIPVLQIEKIDTLQQNEEAELEKHISQLKPDDQPVSERKRKARLKNIENVYPDSPRQKRPFRKSVENTETENPLKIFHISLKDAATSPLSIVLPILPATTDAIDFENKFVAEEVSRPKRRGVKVITNEPVIRTKRVTKQVHEAAVENKEQAKSVAEPLKRGGRKKKADSTETATQDENLLPSTSPTSATPPKRVTRKGRKLVMENPVESSPPKQSNRRGRAASISAAAPASKVVEATPVGKKRTTRQTKEKVESTQRTTGRSTRNKEEKTEEPVLVAQTKRTTKKAAEKLLRESTTTIKSIGSRKCGDSAAETESQSEAVADMKPERKTRSKKEKSVPEETLKEPERKIAKSTKRIVKNTNLKETLAATAGLPKSSNNSSAEECKVSTDGKEKEPGTKSRNVTFSKVSLTLRVERKRLCNVRETTSDEPTQKRSKVESVTRKSVRVTNDNSKMVSKKLTKIVKTKTTAAATNKRRTTKTTAEVHPEHESSQPAKSSRNPKAKNTASVPSGKGKVTKTKTDENSPPIARVTRSRSKL